MVAISSTTTLQANDAVMAKDGNTLVNNGIGESKSRTDILEELDNLLVYIDEDNSLPTFFPSASTTNLEDAENTVPTLTTIAEETEISTGLEQVKKTSQLESPTQPGLFSERLEKIKKKALESEQSNKVLTEETFEKNVEEKTLVVDANIVIDNLVTESEAANEDNVPTLSNEAALEKPVSTDVEQIIDIFIQEQMPILEAKLRARLKQQLGNEK